jgi:lipoate-protein ligase B
MKNKMNVVDLGLITYQEAYQIQKTIYYLCYKTQLEDTLLFQENYPVITLGRSSAKQHVLVDPQQLHNYGIDVVHVDRGGDVTFHGPGQWVVSIISNLKNRTSNIHTFLRMLEKVIMITLNQHGLSPSQKENLSGVWVDDKKIASIGIAVEHGITRHGFALNVNLDLSYFDLIVACGIEKVEMTSMAQLADKKFNMNHIKEDLLNAFKQVFDIEYQIIQYKKGMFNNDC